MKGKEGLLITIVLILLVIGIVGYIIFNNKKNNIIEEYVPEEEISEEQLRQTIVTLYFKNKENCNITTEARKVDVSTLIKDPYNYLVELLISGPKNENLEKLIPNDVKLNGTKLEGDNLIIDLSKEFIVNGPSEEQDKKIIIESITKTLTELTEVNSIKILIDGEVYE